MKKKCSVLRVILILDFLSAVLLFSILVYGIWCTNAPAHVNILFPEGTQFLQETDTHQGLFRQKGKTIIVAQIPADSVQIFGAYLAQEGFWDPSPYDEAKRKLELIPEADMALKSDNILWTYQDEALAFIEKPFSDFFAAIYDLETGLFCFIEYDE